MRKNPQPQEIYRHFKGDLYQIITLAEHTETGEDLVIYRALYGSYKTYARSLSMFMEKTDSTRYPHISQEYRFVRQNIMDANDPFDERDVRAPETSYTAFYDEAECNQSTDQADRIQDDDGQEEVISKTSRLFNLTCMQEEEEESDWDLPGIDPQLLKFLNAATSQQRLQILSDLHHRVTDEMINIMAISGDLVIADGELEDRYEELRRCLMTRSRYEVFR